MTAVERHDIQSCAVLTLNRPAVRNAMNDEVVSALEQHLDAIAASELRAVIITGSGKGFCAGTDLKEMMALGYEGYQQRIGRMHRLLGRLREFPCISIAAVHGPALGGGTELAGACTFRVASPDALFGLPEILLGVMPCYGGTQNVTRLIGESRALDLMLTGRTIDADEALSMGLINRISGEHQCALDAALALAGQVSGFSAVAQRAIRTATLAAGAGDIAAGLAIERQQAAIAFASEDAREGVGAFLAKREPRFRDR
jgi:enoyl-CoA hydratase